MALIDTRHLACIFCGESGMLDVLASARHILVCKRANALARETAHRAIEEHGAKMKAESERRLLEGKADLQ